MDKYDEDGNHSRKFEKLLVFINNLFERSDEDVTPIEGDTSTES